VAPVTNRVRDIPTEVPLDRRHGVEEQSVINCDNVQTVPKAALVRYRGTLGPAEVARLNDALRIALGLD
jgi:mRNA interferase MazF